MLSDIILSVFMLNAANKMCITMLSVNMLNVIMLSVMAPMGTSGGSFSV